MTLSARWCRLLLGVLTALMLTVASPALADEGSNNGGNNNDGDGIVNS